MCYYVGVLSVSNIKLVYALETLVAFVITVFVLLSNDMDIKKAGAMINNV